MFLFVSASEHGCNTDLHPLWVVFQRKKGGIIWQCIVQSRNVKGLDKSFVSHYLCTCE